MPAMIAVLSTAYNRGLRLKRTISTAHSPANISSVKFIPICCQSSVSERTRGLASQSGRLYITALNGDSLCVIFVTSKFAKSV